MLPAAAATERLAAWLAPRANIRSGISVVAAGLLVGGALGNLADRAREGAVTDCIELPAWPTFNLADMAIIAGVLLLLLTYEREPEGE